MAELARQGSNVVAMDGQDAETATAPHLWYHQKWKKMGWVGTVNRGVEDEERRGM